MNHWYWLDDALRSNLLTGWMGSNCFSSMRWLMNEGMKHRNYRTSNSSILRNQSFTLYVAWLSLILTLKMWETRKIFSSSISCFHFSHPFLQLHSISRRLSFQHLKGIISRKWGRIYQQIRGYGAFFFNIKELTYSYTCARWLEHI